MLTDRLGLYVHIPYCVKKCNYCDFCSLPQGGAGVPDEYVEALCTEILSYEKNDKICLNTVYFGGGTPSLLSSSQMKMIVSTILKAFDISANAEITVEANPGTLTDEKVSVYKELGFSRASLGLQSIHEKELKILGRIHTFDDFLLSYELVKKHGIDNVNVDLMYALPGQRVSDFTKSLERVIELSPTHISAYSLILEEGTRLYDVKDTLTFPTEDEECDIYNSTIEIMRRAGYLHYEISNYAKAGFECRHNLKYWQDEEYIGLGLAAHSYYGKKRYSNPTCFSEYFSREEKGYIQTDIISPSDNAYEYAMMHLRLARGFSLSDYKARFSEDFLSGRESFISEIIAAGYMKIDNDRIFLTESGFYVSNEILSRLL